MYLFYIRLLNNNNIYLTRFNNLEIFNNIIFKIKTLFVNTN